MAARTFDAIVIGGGIVGAACARELALNGLKVAICETDRQIGAGGATAAAMGHVAVMDDSDAQFALTRFSQSLWRELAPVLPADAEYQACGALWIASDEEELAEARRKCDFYRSRGVAAEILCERELVEAEPNLRPGLRSALALPADAVCHPPSVARAFAEQALQTGGELLTNTGIAAISDEGVLTQTGGRISAGLVVVAAGTATPNFLPHIEVKPRKGHLAMTAPRPGFLRHQVLELGYLKSAHAVASDSVAFVVQPRATGQVVIGSSRQFGIVDSAIDDSMLQRIKQRAFEYMPGLAELPIVQTWTGFRPATSRKLPFIGLCPDFRNVYVATGHEGLGISTSLATARLISDEIFGRDSAISRDPYRPVLSAVPLDKQSGQVVSSISK